VPARALQRARRQTLFVSAWAAFSTPSNDKQQQPTIKMSLGRKKSAKKVAITTAVADDFVDNEPRKNKYTMGLLISKTAVPVKKKVGGGSSRSPTAEDASLLIQEAGDHGPTGYNDREVSSSLSSSARSNHDDDEEEVEEEEEEEDISSADDDKKKKNSSIVRSAPPTTSCTTTTTRPVGIRNLGNTCYMNSALQCLMATEPLTAYFRSGLYREELNVDNPLGAKGQLALEYGQLLDELARIAANAAVTGGGRTGGGHNNNKGGGTIITPRTFKAKLDEFASQFRGHRQHDAQELLAFLLDGIHEDLNRIHKKPYIEDKDCDGTNDEADAVLAWQNYLKRDKSPIVDMFQGQLRSELRCRQCQHGNVRFEPFMYLSLPIAATATATATATTTTTTLSDCLEAYLRKETLTGDNQWYCSQCQSHVDATKKTDLWIVPPILIIHLKRFKQQEPGLLGKVVAKSSTTATTKIMSSKNSAVIHFDEYWNCTEFCDGGDGDDGTHQQQQSSHSPQYSPHEYDLYGVSHHHGKSLGGGHYTASVRHGQQWYYCNDQTVQTITDDDIFAANDASAYLLFYQRRSNTMGVRRQSESRPDLWPHANSQRRVVEKTPPSNNS
jgi:ubiquitin carboxyl-terminal hydrolase 8